MSRDFFGLHLLLIGISTSAIGIGATYTQHTTTSPLFRSTATLFGLLGDSTIYSDKEGKHIGRLCFGFTAIGTIFYYC
jgi:hypothetical protein